jgi:site-specific DNA-methyltransferase (adenine-specific)
MSRVEVIGDATLYLGDCRDILPTLGKVDAVVTDIPYEISQRSNGLRRLDYGEWDGAGATDDALAVLALLSDVPSIVAWCSAEQISRLHDAHSERQRRTLVWTKPNPPVLNGQHLFLSSQELGFYGKTSGAWFGGSCVRSYWHGPTPMDREHPTQKPLPLMHWCVQHTVPPAGVCLDPFMGSGTTGVASANLGRAFVGIEREPTYFDIACRRIEAAYKQPRLFAEPIAKPVQEAML